MTTAIQSINQSIDQGQADPTRRAILSSVAPGVLGGIRILLGGILVWAGAGKLLQTSSFAADIARYQIMPDGLSIVIASALPMMEVGLGLCLLSATCLLPALTTTAVLLLAFLLAQISVMARGLTISCGCFGSDSPVGTMSIIRTTSLLFSALFACGVLLFILRQQHESLPQPIGVCHE